MPYTLVKFILWALLLAAIGGIIGWLLRSLTCRVEMSRLRAGAGDADELERMRHRLVELDAVTAERDRLRMEIADVRGSSAGTLGFATIADADSLAAVSRRGVPDADEPPPPAVGESEAGGDGDVGSGLTTLVPADGESTDSDDPTSDDIAASAAATVDIDTASRVLGRPITLDDLTVVEGIGPKIAELCAGIGLVTWRDLAEVDVATLQSMLADAGSRFKMHKPDTWPRQAALLADRRWDDFKALTDQLEGGA